MTFDERVVAQLARLVSDRGAVVSSNPDVVRAGLSDLLGPDARALRAEIDALALASEEDVVGSIELDGGRGVMDRLSRRGLTADMAAAAMNSWRSVLDGDVVPEATSPGHWPHDPDLETASSDPGSPATDVVDVAADQRPARGARRRARLLVPLGLLVAVLLGATALAVTGDDDTDVGDADLVAVVDVVGRDLEAATLELETLDLEVTLEFDPDADAPAGTVVTMAPEPGTSVQPGTVITLTIAGSDPAEPTEVPDVVGLPLSEATAALARAGLEVGEVSEDAGSDAPPGTVVEQGIAAGAEAASGDTVDLVVSSIPEIEIPDVTDHDVDGALAALADAGFIDVTTRSDPSSRAPTGAVLGTEPAAGSTVSADTPIVVVQSGRPHDDPGPEERTIPSVVGRAVGDARATLEGAGFGVNEQRAPSTNTPRDHVISMSPGAGTAARIGSLVTITVSSGPPAPTTVAVPNVVGRTQSDAVAILGQSQLEAKVVSTNTSDPAKNGRVLGQDPTGGRVPPGSTVEIRVGKFVNTKPVARDDRFEFPPGTALSRVKTGSPPPQSQCPWTNASDLTGEYVELTIFDNDTDANGDTVSFHRTVGSYNGGCVTGATCAGRPCVRYWFDSDPANLKAHIWIAYEAKDGRGGVSNQATIEFIWRWD